MKTLFGTLIASLLFLGACSKDDFPAKLESWSKAACACKDKECGEKQKKAFRELGKAAKEANYKPSSKAEEEKLDKVADKGQDCLKELGVDVYR